jgi:hypothetical protein
MVPSQYIRLGQSGGAIHVTSANSHVPYGDIYLCMHLHGYYYMRHFNQEHREQSVPIWPSIDENGWLLVPPHTATIFAQQTHEHHARGDFRDPERWTLTYYTLMYYIPCLNLHIRHCKRSGKHFPIGTQHGLL